MLGGAAAGAARRIRETLVEIAAHNLGCTVESVEYSEGNASVRGQPGKRITWSDLVTIAHRRYHQMPPGVEPGLQAKFVWEVPTGGQLPTPDGRVQMYPCFSFETHIVYVEIDPDTAQPSLRQYVCGHDCGVMINPDIVHGMTYGGIAHGVGAALYEKFAYTADGQLAAGTFMDYLIPSAMEVPTTTFGQKGSGEAGYLGAPAAIANAVNDALAPLDAAIETLPMTHDALWRTIHGK
jgi:CO/xanthine dehydrogenase Mo-binding subunit